MTNNKDKSNSSIFFGIMGWFVEYLISGVVFEAIFKINAVISIILSTLLLISDIVILNFAISKFFVSIFSK